MATIGWKATMCISGPFLCGLAYTLFKNKSNKPCDTTLNEVLLYGAKDEKQTKEIGLENLFCIYYVIAHATRTVDVCVPCLDSETVANCLINVQQKSKAKIRVAIHNSNQIDNLKLFAEHGIEVKVIQSYEPLEHEFILVDACEDFGESLAVLGSLDYETTRVNCNRDSTMLTSERKVVIALKKEFERIWNSGPNVLRE